MSRNGNRAERRRQTASTADLTVALDHHRAGRLDRAEALYRKFLRKSPDHPDALHLLGVIAALRGDAGRAIELIGQALTARPHFAEAPSNLGNALRTVGRLAEAAANYRRALALRPDFAAAHSNLGILGFCRRPDRRIAHGACRLGVPNHGDDRLFADPG
jgi:Flp pilus assembly protein TadD